MTTLLSRLADARTIETPAATMRTLASPGFGPGLDPALPVSVWRTEVAAGTPGPEHVVDVDHFVVVLEGALEVRVDGVEHRLGAGDGILVPAGSTRVIRAGDTGAVTVTLGGAGGRATVGDADPVLIPWSA